MAQELEFDRKYRPQDFESYIGNTTVKEKLKNMIKKDNLPHSILFEGPSGTGKTTMARIVAKVLSCKSPKEDGTPCEKCENCTRINEKFILTGGKVPGLPIQEVDVNLDGSKDSITQLIDEMKTKPLGKQKKIYILDEVQTMSAKAQSSLLKVLEEPSEWLYIILCTTHPDALLDAIKTRLTSFKIRQPSKEELRKRLIDVCLEEKIKYDKAALDVIIKVSEKSPRLCLKNLERVASSGEVLYEAVLKEFNIAKIDMFINYFKSLKGDIFGANAYIEGLTEKYNTNYIDFLDSLVDFTIDAFQLKMGSSLENYTEDEAKEMARTFKEITTEDMIRLLNYLEDALRFKSNPRFALFMLTMKFGFPEHFAGVTHRNVAEDIQKEKDRSTKEYLRNKEEINKSKIESDELTGNDILELFEDSFRVDDDIEYIEDGGSNEIDLDN